MSAGAGAAPPPGRFIVLEGPDGVGKSTQASRVAERLGALLTREPGGTAVGQAIRALVLDRSTVDLDERAEALLMAADRAQHVAAVVRPALRRGVDVVSDRYLYSSVAYQGHGRGLSPEEVAQLSSWATGGLVPDVVLYLDAAEPVVRARRPAAGDRVEASGHAFFARVRAGYRAQYDADPQRWARIDAAGDVEAVTEAIMDVLAERGITARVGT